MPKTIADANAPMPEDVEPIDLVTDADVVDAEREAEEAEAFVASLEKKVQDGAEDITIEEIDAQEKVSRFARLRASGVRAKAERYRVASRTAAAHAVREEIENYATGSGERFSALLQAVKDAEDAFVAAVDGHDLKIQGWRQRAETGLQIPETDGRPMPPEIDGHIALGKGSTLLHVGRRRLEHVGGKSRLDGYRSGDPEAHIAVLKQIDAPVPDSTAQHFYRGEGGSVIAYDRPFSDEDVKRLHLVQLTRKEAWGE